VNFFVQALSEDNTDEENKKIRDHRMNAFEGILRQQFQLSYFGHISYEASESMQVSEREYMFHILVDQKDVEKKQHEEAMKAAKAKKASKGKK
jgi:hypothetical protein